MAINQETGMQHVENLLNNTFNFGIYHSAANTEVFDYLMYLRDFLADQEQEFYDILNVGSIGGLNALLKNINISHNLSVLDAGGVVFQEIKNKFIFKDKSKSDDQKDQKTEQDIFTLLNETLNEIPLDKFYTQEDLQYIITNSMEYDLLMEMLANAFNNIKFDNGMIKYEFRTMYGKTSVHSKKTIGEAKIVVIDLIKAIKSKGKTPGKITIADNHIKFTGNSLLLPPKTQEEIRNVIRPALEEYLNKSYEGKKLLENMSFDQIRSEVIKIIREKGVYLDNDDIKACDNIDIGAGAGNISGFLGELQSRLIFKALFQNIKDARIIDKGASFIKSMSGATQMDPADTMVQVANQIFNIQVKNYAKGGAEWGSSGKSKMIQIFEEKKEVKNYMTAVGFMQERLQLKDRLLTEFFGAATWHNLNPKYSKDPSYEKYKIIYKEFSDIFDSLKDTFDTFLPNIIRLTALINGVDTQYENFYFQKGYMIPASAIIDGIIDALYNAPSNKIFTSSYEMYPGESKYTYENPWVNDYTPFAKDTMIAYHVSINFNIILRNLGL